MVFQFRSMANGSSYNILQRIDCRSKGVDSREAPMRAMPRASILSVLRQSGEHPETRFVRRLSFIQLLHQVTRRRKPPRSDFFVRCPAQKEYKASASFSPAEIKHMIGLPERLVGSFFVLVGNRNADAMPTSRLAFVENCIGSWLTERKWRGNGRSAGGGAALGSPACCDNCTRDALGRKPRCSRATDRRGPPRAIIYNFRRIRPPRLELTQ